MKNANPVSLWAPAALAFSAALFAAACRPATTASGGASQKTVLDHFLIAVDGHPASLQVAVRDDEQEHGLMQRPDLGQDEGMIFVDPSPRRLSIWMSHTPEPLDLAYLSPAGEVTEIYALLPLDERPVESHSSEVQFALEMHQGWFARNGIHPGSKLDMKAFAAALKERGYDPGRFGIR